MTKANLTGEIPPKVSVTKTPGGQKECSSSKSKSDIQTVSVETDIKHNRQAHKEEGSFFSKSERKTLILAILINLSFFICNSPMRVYQWFVQTQVYDRSDVLEIVFGILFILYPLTHPFIYIFSLKTIRDKFCFCKRNL